MRTPQRPPSLAEITPSPERLTEVLSSGIAQLPAGSYLHWDKLRRKPPPEGFTHKEWWFAKKVARRTAWRELPLMDKDNEPFRFLSSDAVQRMVHHIDQLTSGTIEAPVGVTNRDTKNRYLISSLFEEPVTSSQLEGAATTTRVAKDMLRTGRKPHDHGEQMIFNNFEAMRFVREIASEDLTPALILELHRIVADETVADERAVGRWRTEHDDVVVTGQYGDILHTPPSADQLPARIARLCEFANQPSSDEAFLHPVVKAILLHFMIGYDHPFVDGNGRTARALYYWFIVRAKYWLMEYVSISTILHRQPADYARAYLYTETDDNDTTYFVEYNLGVIKAAIDSLYEYLHRKDEEFKDVERFLTSPTIRKKLNHRQVALLGDALKEPNTLHTIQSHLRSNHVYYQTARTDLLGLAEIGLLEKEKLGKAFVFTAPSDLKERLSAFADR
jgi:Fic family protein